MKKQVDYTELVEKVPLAKQFIPVLKLLAIRNETITYKELGQLFGIHYRAIPSYLRVIDIYCEKNRLPKLTYLVVHQLSQVAGGANYSDAPSTFTDQIREQEKIFSHNWLKDILPDKNRLYRTLARTIANVH